MISMKKVKEHPVVVFLSAIVVGFVAGWVAYDTVLNTSGRTTVGKDTLQVLKEKLKTSEERIVALEKKLLSQGSSPGNESNDQRVHILRARIIGKQNTKYDISPTTCPPDKPCGGKNLVRGATLHADLNQKGYAAAYLQDQYGNFYNQEGRLFIRNLNTGSTKLWPGIPGYMAYQDFKLWIVTSNQKIPTYTDSDPRKELPKVSHGTIWGPIHLIFQRD